MTAGVITAWVCTWWHGAGHVQWLRYLSLSVDTIFEYNRVIVIGPVIHTANHCESWMTGKKSSTH